MQQSILIVEDDKTVRTTLVRALHMSDFRVIEAESGHDAMSQALKEIPDLIITDMEMKDGNGIWMAQELQRHSATRSTPLILMTGGESVEGTIPNGLPIRAQLQKPFSLEEFVAAIKEALLTPPNCS